MDIFQFEIFFSAGSSILMYIISIQQQAAPHKVPRLSVLRGPMFYHWVNTCFVEVSKSKYFPNAIN
jgi:hypothetical protein